VGLTLFTGLAIDKFGPGLCSLVFSAVMLLGVTLNASTAPGPYALAWLLLGRMCLGLGESLTNSASVMIERWHSGRMLTFACGFNQAFVQLFGSAATFYVLPLLHSVPTAQWVVVGVCVASLTANVAYVGMSRFFLPPHEAPPSSAPASSTSFVLEVGPALRSLPLLFWLVIAMASLLSPILYTYTAFGPSLLMERFGLSEVEVTP
jgi:MFS family permease